MSRFRVIVSVTVVVIVSVVGFGWTSAQHGGSSPVALTGQDYEEIKALYARYNQGSDFRDAELFLSAFADDAIMTRGGRDIVGMDALRAERAERYAGQTGDVGRRHYNGSFMISPPCRGRESADLLPPARCDEPATGDGLFGILRRCVHQDIARLADSAPDAAGRWAGPLTTRTALTPDDLTQPMRPML